MPSRETFRDGMPCWIDLISSNPAKAAEFYSQLLGWVVEDMGPDYGNYTKFLKNGQAVAGLIGNSESSGFPDGWITYFAAGDLQAVTEKAGLAGAEVLVAPFAVSDQGSVAHLSDPSGATFGLWQGNKLRGFELHGEPGAAVWHELMTRQYRQCIDFYTRVLDWDPQVESDAEDFRYTTGLLDGDQQAGIMDAASFLPEGAPSAWGVYFGVDNTDDAADRVPALGGTVIAEPEDSPYGRLCTATDPTGAGFKLISS
jgi:predicted enzyme related to lactoylglutathione lyase